MTRTHWAAAWTLTIAAALFVEVALADGKPRSPGFQTQSQSADSTASSSSDISAPQSVSSDTSVRAFGFGGSAAQAIPVIGCPLYLPGDGHNRAWWVLGVSTSGVYERNDECWVAMEAELDLKRLEAEARLIEAQNEQARLAASADLAECAEARERVAVAWRDCETK